MDTQEKHKVLNVIILDESGSMVSIKEPIITAFNELIQNIKEEVKKYPDQEHSVTFVSFNGNGIKTHFENVPISSLDKINSKKYNPNNNTPLYDAMGFTLTKLEKITDTLKNYNVIVTIFTDGYENASTEYNSNSIIELVNKLKDKNWIFNYVGTEHDVEKAASEMGISNFYQVSKDSNGILDAKKFMFCQYQINMCKISQDSKK